MDASTGFIIGGCIFLALGVFLSIPSIKRLDRIRRITKKYYRFWFALYGGTEIDDEYAEKLVDRHRWYLLAAIIFGFPMLVFGLSMR